MAVVNSFIALLQSPLHPHLCSYTSAELELEEDISNLSRAEGYLSNSIGTTCEKQQGFPGKDHQLRSTKSTESLNTLLSSLPEVIIPETLYNPLPLQCLAAGALPEAVREEIDQVLDHYSNAMSSSQSAKGLHKEAGIATGGSSSALLNGAETDGGIEGGGHGVRGDMAVNEEGVAILAGVGVDQTGESLGASMESNEVRVLLLCESAVMC